MQDSYIWYLAIKLVLCFLRRHPNCLLLDNRPRPIRGLLKTVAMGIFGNVPISPPGYDYRVSLHFCPLCEYGIASLIRSAMPSRN